VKYIISIKCKKYIFYNIVKIIYYIIYINVCHFQLKNIFKLKKNELCVFRIHKTPIVKLA